MKTSYLLLLLFTMLIFSCKYSGNSANEGDYYDRFKGDKSSLINLTQYESFSKCVDEFDFSKYENNKITLSINAPNDFVYDQINILLKNKFLEKNIEVIKPVYDNKNIRTDSKVEKYDLQFTAICGGYYFYDGFVVKNYKSITRLVLIANDIDNNKKTSYDSKYQVYKYKGVEFTDLFKIFIYTFIMTIILSVIVVILKKYVK